ncbi:MAG: EF-P beta-lysylation protein EpmB [Gammaproteobacteria bacterium]
MITRSPVGEERPAWREALARAWRDPRALLAMLDLEPAALGLDGDAARRFPFRVTREWAARMRPGDPHDPLLRQVLPVVDENRVVPGFGADPVGEQHLGDGSTLLRKYAGRGLLVMTGACAINCRYCFRREYPYGDHVGARALAAGLDAIEADPGIDEVILSGGDPLVLDDAVLAPLLERIATQRHVRRLRVHSRLPVVLPARMTPRLLELFASQPQQVVLVVHVNHAQEIDDATAAALARCRAAGVTLLNQAVLLAGVNDDVEVLAALSHTLFEAGVLPYYLHLLDRVAGSAHFEVPEARVAALAAGLRAALPGYLVPRFVREVAGAPAKTPFVPPRP